MALPNNLAPLDFEFGGVVFCDTTAKGSIDPFSMDFDYQGVVYVTNVAISTSSAPVQIGLDKVDNGLPFAWEVGDIGSIDLTTLDYQADGLPLATNPVGSDQSLYAGVQTIEITAPSAEINGLLRKYPLARNEFVSSNNESAHVFPYVTIQDPGLIP